MLFLDNKGGHRPQAAEAARRTLAVPGIPESGPRAGESYQALCGLEVGSLDLLYTVDGELVEDIV